MVLPQWYAILLGFVFIGYMVTILICTRLYPDYSPLKRTISGLGNPQYKSAKLFNPATFILGLLTIPFPFYVFQGFEPSILATIGCILMCFNPIGLMLLGIFNETKNTGHMIGAVFAMGFLLFSDMILIYPLLISSFYNIILALIGILAILLCIPLTIAAQKSAKEYVGDIKYEKIVENINFWEWLEFIVLEVWVIGFYINLL